MATPIIGGKFFDYRAVGLSPGAALYTYAAGTLTPLATYTDAGGGSSNANPVICNVYGQADVFLGTSAYRMRLYSDTIGNGGTLLWDEDNILAGADLADVSTALKGDAMIGWGAITATVDGVLTRYASLAAAVTGVGSTLADIVVRDASTVAANTTIPATCTLRIINEAIITISGATTLTINGPFVASAAKCFVATGTVTFGLGSTAYVLPEWWGAKGDANAAGTTGTDSTAAIQAALNVPTIPVLIGYGNWLFSNLTMPSEKAIYGSLGGVHSTNLIAKTGSTGTMFTDQGSAAKITVSGIAFYGNNCAYTQGFRLGYNGTAFGTEGLIENVWVRDLPSGFAGIDINGNVGHIGRILSQDTGGMQIVGAANMVAMAQSYGAKGFTVSATTVGCNLQLTRVNVLEIEAPATGVIPLYLSGNSSIGTLTAALADGFTHAHIVEIGASCSTWNIDGFNLVFGAGAGPTITNGNFKTGSHYFGGNASGKSYGGEGNYTSEYLGQRPQCFALTIINSAGTLQHAVRDPGGNSATSGAALINAASSSFGNTPTGADGSTAMATGGKIGSASTNTFWLDTPAQLAANSQFNASIVFNSSGTALTCTAAFVSLDINGVTRTRLALQFYNATSGAAFALTTGNIAASKSVQVVFNGRLS